MDVRFHRMATPIASKQHFWTRPRIVVAAILLLLASAAMQLALCFALATGKVNWFGYVQQSKTGVSGSIRCDLWEHQQFGVRACSAGIWDRPGTNGLSRDEFVRAVPEARGHALPATLEHAEYYNSLAVGFPFHCVRGWQYRPVRPPAQSTTPNAIIRHGIHHTRVGHHLYEIPYHIAPIPFALNVLIIALTLFSIGALVEFGRIRFLGTRRKPGHCSNCGYDLHGITTACPECGVSQLVSAD